MSKKQTAAAAAEPPQAASFDSFQGEDLNLPDIDGWYSPVEKEEGWVGRLLGMFKITNEDGERDVAVFRLLSSCTSAAAEGEPVSLSPGHVLAVSYRAQLRNIFTFVPGKATIACRATGKKKLDGKKSMWLFDVKGTGEKQPDSPVAGRKPARGAESEPADDSTPEF